MIFNTGAALLDAIVLSVVSKETNGTYGYKITQDVRNALDVSESTLYPVLRRLLKDNCLETYDQEYQEEIVAIIKLHLKDKHNYRCIVKNGRFMYKN